MDCSCGNNPKDEEMNSILEKYSKDKSNLIQILNEVQENYGYIPKYSQISISEYLDIPLAEIYGVITFYARFTLKPKGKYNITICLNFLKKCLNLLKIPLEAAKAPCDHKDDF